jgi:hypothetical protein
VTRVEAEQLAAIFETADGECQYCAAELARLAASKWPEHPWKELTKAHFADCISEGAWE